MTAWTFRLTYYAVRNTIRLDIRILKSFIVAFARGSFAQFMSNRNESSRLLMLLKLSSC